MARLAVIGAGVVGLSCAFHLIQDGHQVTVFDPELDGDKCSWGNAGGIGVTEVVPAAIPGALWRVPGWIADPLGPLSLSLRHAPAMAPWFIGFVRAGRPARVAAIAAVLSGLLSRVYGDLCPLLAALGLADVLHRDGALTVYESQAALLTDQAEWDLKRQHGLVCQIVSGAETRELEPALSPRIQAGVFTPAWSHVSDPKQIWAALLAAIRARGATVTAQPALALPHPGTVQTPGGEVSGFDRIVVAAGAWSGGIAETVGDRVLLESERGYNTTIASPGIELTREVIFAERKFVATPLSVGLRIGGAAAFVGLKAPPRYERAAVLAQLAKDYLPRLCLDGGTQWMGQRPTTPDSLPVIGPSPKRPDVIYAFGHGHLGLTLAATTGLLVAGIVKGDPGAPSLSIGRFA